MPPLRPPRPLSLSRVLTLAVVATLLGPRALAGPQPEVTCEACLVVVPGGDQTFFARAAAERRANASTTKMVTALVALEHLAPGDRVQVSGAVGSVPSTVELAPGDPYEAGDLVAAMMLESWNDAAVALAEAAAGSQDAFVAEMNDYVADLGLRDTAFVNPHGLDAPGHHSSASDLARIGEEVLADPYLAGIVGRRTFVIDGPSGSIELTSRNELLGSYPGAIGIKTGQTLQAGNVLVAAAERHGNTLIAVVMDSADTFADASRLLDLGFAELERIQARTVLAEPGTPAGAIVFDGAGSVPVGLGRVVRGPHDPDLVTYRLVIEDGVSLPIDEGASVGMITVEVEGEVVRRVPAVALAGLDAPAESWGTSFFSGLLGLFEPVAGVL